jgi:DDE family transposase
MKPEEAIENDWLFLLTLLPAGWDTAAWTLGALRRKRGLSSPAMLLRLVFAYGYSGLSLRDTALWAREAGVALLSAVALWKRLRRAAPWLGWLVMTKLAQRAALPRVRPGARRVRLVDATVVSKPGSKGTDFRIHLGLDLGRLLIDEVEVTRAGGETFQRHRIQPGELVIGDRAYARRPGMAAVVAAGGDLLVRLNGQDLPLQEAAGQPFDLRHALRSLVGAQVGDWKIRVAPGEDGTAALEGRLLALRKSPQAAEAARRKIRREARKKGREPGEWTLELAGYVLLFTTLSPEGLTATEGLELYRFRWQIELTFKRMKSLVGLDELTSQDEALGRTFLLAKILATLLIEELSHRWVDFSPWGYGCPAPAVGVAGLSDDGGDPAPGGGSGAHPGAVDPEQAAAPASLARHSPPPFQPNGPSPFPFLLRPCRIS